MKSPLPKILHTLAEKPLIDWVLDTVALLDISKTIIVVGHNREKVIKHISNRSDIGSFDFAVQEELLGTADAVKRALPKLPAQGDVFVLCGDVPLLQAETLKRLLSLHKKTSAAATILTAILENPSGYGRIVRSADNSVEKIVEHRDASDDELKIREINSGTYVFELAQLRKAIALVKNDNAQAEFYLTDVIHILRESFRMRISAISVKNHWEIEGINSKKQLAEMEKYLEEF